MPVTLEELAKPRSFEQEKLAQNPLELILDKELERLGTVHKPSYIADRSLGIDRILKSPDGVLTTFQYKVEWAANRTGNMFIETEQRLVRDCDKEVTKVWPGWYKVILAQMLLCLVPQNMTLHVCNVPKLKALAKVISSRYSLKQCRAGSKESYSPEHTLFGIGFAVPFDDLMELGAITRIIKLERDGISSKYLESDSSCRP